MAGPVTQTRLAMLLVLGALLLPVGAGVGVVWHMANRPPEVRRVVRVVAVPPEQVAEGEAFDLVVTVLNNTQEPVKLRGIDLAGTYLGGFVLIRTAPAYDDETEGPAFRRFDFDRRIPPGGEADVTFRLQAVAAGTYTGDIDARLSGQTPLITTRATTRVLPPGSTTPDNPGGSGEDGSGDGDSGDDGPPLIIQPAEE